MARKKKVVKKAKKRANKINKRQAQVDKKLSTPISRQIRKSKEYQKWRTEVLKRGNNRCTLCGTDEDVHCHHLVYMSRIIKMYGLTTMEQARKCQILWSPENGIPVCGRCHEIIHGNGFGWYF